MMKNDMSIKTLKALRLMKEQEYPMPSLLDPILEYGRKQERVMGKKEADRRRKQAEKLKRKERD